MPYDFAKEIKNVVNCAKFDEDDFELINNGRDISIKYIYSKKGYCFKFNIPDTKEEVRDNNSVSLGLYQTTKWRYVFNGTFIPGKYANRESFTCYSFSDVKNEINNWINNLYEELKKTSDEELAKTGENSEEFEKYQKQFEDIEKMIDEQMDDNEVFSQEDKELFSKKLDDIKNEFDEQLKKVILEQETLKVELDKVNEDFSKLKDSLNYMSKRNWGKKFLRKTKEFFKDDNKRKIAFTLLKGTNIFLKECNIDVPLLDEGIEAINQISGDK